jgi:ADP-ribosylation factor-like protein 2
MGLLTVIRKNQRKEKEMRILFLYEYRYHGTRFSFTEKYATCLGCPDVRAASSGLDNAGKTTILKRLNGDDIDSVSPTLGFEIKTFVHGKCVRADALSIIPTSSIVVPTLICLRI